tara:strand:+ start:93 stop:371 length:279 start_codon:yes stop_codon:yes gene_type:complete
MTQVTEEKMEVVGYSEDKDSFYYFDNKTDEQVTFPLKDGVESAARKLFGTISKWADVVAYSSSMDFEFPEKHGKDGLKVFNDVGNEYYQNNR